MVIVIPHITNTSQEFKLPISFGFKENETLVLARNKKGTVTEDVSTDIRHLLRVMSFLETSEYIVHKGFTNDIEWPAINEETLALMDMPIFQTFEGYILREGFRFSYYLLGESSSLELGPPPPLE